MFNALTGARQKVGNYPGVTVERHSGRLILADGRPVELVDLPGAYSLEPASPDEAVTRDVLLGKQQGERQPDALVIVLDASNLDNHLRFALQLIELGLPTIIALNMVDLAKRDGLELSSKRLSDELGVPVVETIAVRRRGITELQSALDDMLSAPQCGLHKHVKSDLVHLQRRAREIATHAVASEAPVRRRRIGSTPSCFIRSSGRSSSRRRRSPGRSGAGPMKRHSCQAFLQAPIAWAAVQARAPRRGRPAQLRRRSASDPARCPASDEQVLEQSSRRRVSRVAPGASCQMKVSR